MAGWRGRAGVVAGRLVASREGGGCDGMREELGEWEESCDWGLADGEMVSRGIAGMLKVDAPVAWIGNGGKLADDRGWRWL